MTYVHVNGFASAWAGSLGQLGLKEPPRQEIEVYGEGNVKFSMVAAEDIARYAARALFDPRTKDRHTLITPSENVLTQNELIAIWESKTKTKLQRRTVSAEELDIRIMELARAPEKRAQLALAQLVRAAWIDGLGGGARRPEVIELTALYPDIQYQRVTSYLDRLLSPVQATQ
jgi:nucleoside-diphosphate-sugar epimerase